MKSRWLLLVACLVGSGAHAEGPAEASTWYARKLTAGDTALRIEHFWSKGRKLHAETVIAGHPIVTLVDAQRYTVLDLLTATGLSIERGPAARRADAGGGRPFGNEGRRLRALGAEKVRTERLAGRLCDVYRLTDREGRREVWITHDDRELPVHLEIFDRSSGRSGRHDYLDWTSQLALPDAFFEPDPRIRVERVGYQEYIERSSQGPLGPAPVLYRDLLHGPGGLQLSPAR